MFFWFVTLESCDQTLTWRFLFSSSAYVAPYFGLTAYSVKLSVYSLLEKVREFASLLSLKRIPQILQHRITGERWNLRECLHDRHDVHPDYRF
jgi:hypothetical protein